MINWVYIVAVFLTELQENKKARKQLEREQISASFPELAVLKNFRLMLL
jgi:hypothetical protein